MEADARLDGDVRAKCEADALHEVRVSPDLNVRQGLVMFDSYVSGILKLSNYGNYQNLNQTLY